MASTRVVMNRAAARQLLTSSAVRADLEQRARRIASAAGPGMEVDSQSGPNRARASVRTATFAAMHAEATSRALTRAISAGRG